MPVFNKPTNLEVRWAENGDMSPPPDTSKIRNGWNPEIPPKETFNYIDNRQDSAIAHFNQFGIPLWDSNTYYLAGKSYAQGGDGIVYRAARDNIGVNPTTVVDTLDWVIAFAYAANVYSVGEAHALFAEKDNNLSDLTNVAEARENIGVYSKIQGDTKYSQMSNNLSDLSNKPAAFANIKQSASESTSGVAAIATSAEVSGGTIDDKFVTPLKLKSGFLIDMDTPPINGIYRGSIKVPSWMGGWQIQWITNTGAPYAPAHWSAFMTFPTKACVAWGMDCGTSTSTSGSASTFRVWCVGNAVNVVFHGTMNATVVAIGK